MENQAFCQICGMLLSEEHYGKNGDGTANTDYCAYCYPDGKFAQDISMDEMIESCLQYIDEFNKDSPEKLTVEQAREQMKQYFPTLKRWKA